MKRAAFILVALLGFVFWLISLGAIGSSGEYKIRNGFTTDRWWFRYRGWLIDPK